MPSKMCDDTSVRKLVVERGDAMGRTWRPFVSRKSQKASLLITSLCCVMDEFDNLELGAIMHAIKRYVKYGKEPYDCWYKDREFRIVFEILKSIADNTEVVDGIVDERDVDERDEDERDEEEAVDEHDYSEEDENAAYFGKPTTPDIPGHSEPYMYSDEKDGRIVED